MKTRIHRCGIKPRYLTICVFFGMAISLDPWPHEIPMPEIFHEILWFCTRHGFVILPSLTGANLNTWMLLVTGSRVDVWFHLTRGYASEEFWNATGCSVATLAAAYWDACSFQVIIGVFHPGHALLSSCTWALSWDLWISRFQCLKHW